MESAGMLVNAAEGKGTPVSSGMLIYRGFSDGGGPDPDGAFRPRSPRSYAPDHIVLFERELMLLHVLATKREHFVSFSLTREAALWYATGGGEHDGFLAVCRLPVIREAVPCMGGGPPCGFLAAESGWLDPRVLPITPESPLHDVETIKRAVIDDELLLAAGQVIPIQPPNNVRRTDCPPAFVPWANNGTMESLGELPPLAAERKKKALVSVLA